MRDAGKNCVTNSELKVPYPLAVTVPSTWVTSRVCTLGLTTQVPVTVKSSNDITSDVFSMSDDPTLGVSSQELSNAAAPMAMAANIWVAFSMLFL